MENKLRELFWNQLDAKECFGGAAAVIKGGEVVFCEHFGDERFNENSLYRLASVTKLVVTTLILRLYEEGRLDIYGNVSKYLPQFARIPLGAVAPNGMTYSMQMPCREITLFDLLTHTAGLGAGDVGNREYSLMPPEEKSSLCDACEYYAKNFHLSFEPGSRFAYSGFAGFDVLGRIAEVVTDKTLGTLVEEYICKPLGMTDTTFKPTAEQYDRIVPLHQRISGVDKEANFKGSIIRGIPVSCEAAGASLVSSMSDMIKFCSALPHGKLLKKETLELMFAPSLPDDLEGLTKGENSGLGCFVISGQHRLRKGIIYSHGAYGTHILFDRERDVAAIWLKNSMFNMEIASPATISFENAVLK